MEVEQRETDVTPEVNQKLSNFNEKIKKNFKDCVGLLNISHMAMKAEGEKRISPEHYNSNVTVLEKGTSTSKEVEDAEPNTNIPRV